jgi:hypothetical protein
MGNLNDERVATGNHEALFVSGDGAGTIFGRGVARVPNWTAVNLQRNLGTRHLHAGGSREPFDIVDGAATYEVSISELRLRSSDDQDLLNAGGFRVVIVDQFSQKRLRTARGCRIQGERLNVPANNPVIQDLTILAMSMD